MKTMKRWFANQIKMFYGKFFSLTWKQDLRFINDGYDLIYFGKRKDGYFTGTVKEYNLFMTPHKISKRRK